MKQSLEHKTSLAEDFKILFSLISMKEGLKNPLLKERTEEILEELGEIPKIGGSYDYLFEKSVAKEDVGEEVEIGA